MKKTFLFLSIFIFGILFSQTNRFIYELKYKSDSLQEEFEIAEMVLDINPKDVEFYEYGFIEIDSLRKLPESLITNIRAKQGKQFQERKVQI